ncbi:flagellar basal-body rod protein FlgG [Anaeromyxobacter sp. K]|uniref:Flagellar basal-body rod protein FlgG n=1 Tax=Anaeromyxobacter dehalogenans (strain ATCC BAA-258 / DSM 21875 / 2CP-1) TaxID=455488 RepID=B8JD90_ANAD2|nr:flagellar basal-body rod protein FlgG [Anaeromyxobacter sp. K]ACG73731.1 flagellar basal-body rod protein FlgG [Anaeromyxobacter sp. K]ACL65939.1 flagellar basal-body rod protein FlgG [Anaeromyxobacter dehalogenans 2CP-1]
MKGIPVLRSLYTAATGMEAQQLRMDVIANNLANTGTTGFKRQRAEFEDLLSETIHGAEAPDPRGGTAPAALQVGLGVRTGSTVRNFGQGELLTTGNALDLAIEGDGFFRVQRPDGSLAYTRAGNFRVDAAGRLVTARGEVVDPEITFPPETTRVTVDADGTVRAQVAGREAPQELGRLELCTFPNPGGLEAAGGNLLLQTAASGEAVDARPGEQGAGTLAQGFLEGANVKAVEEMIDMIATQRAYELNSRVVQTADQMLQRLTSLR